MGQTSELETVNPPHSPPQNPPLNATYAPNFSANELVVRRLFLYGVTRKSQPGASRSISTTKAWYSGSVHDSS